MHENLRCDMFRQEQECGVPAQELNANAVGGVAGRNRRYFVPGVDLSKIERFRHVSPDLAADSGWQFRNKPVPAPVARGSSTKSPIVMIRAYGNYNPRFCNSDERDRVNPGLASGISCGYHRTSRLIPPEVRDRANGNAFSADAIWAIARSWVIYQKLPSVLAASDHVDMRSWPSAQQLEKFMIMDQPQLLCYFTRLAVDLVMPRLDIAALVDPIHTLNYQTGAPGFTRAGMGPSCDYCIDLAIKDGTHKEVVWTKELWICLCFFQKKKDRTIVAEFDGATYKKGDVLFAMRPLRDYTKLNSTMALRIPDFWREFCPTIEAIRSMFPSWCKFMAVHDCKNAHHSVKLSDESYKYCNSRYVDGNGKPRIIQALGADQGINAIAFFFSNLGSIWL